MTGSGVRSGWRRGLRSAVPVALVAAAAAIGFGQLRERSAARSAFPTVAGEIALPGLSAPAEVLRDARGVPHIAAADPGDAVLALGFVHAQDRLGQMLWRRLAARGRTAEVLGREVLAADRLARLLGIGRLADLEAEQLADDARAVLEAYARGVNGRIERIRSGRVVAPLAVEGLGLPLEPWTPADSLAVLKYHDWGLSGSLDASLVLSDLIERLGGFGARLFFPRGYQEELGPGEGLALRAARRAPLRVPDPLRRAGGFAGRSLGSSAWVVSGAVSRSGSPLLAADVHLEPTAPAHLYQAHVAAGALEVAGATLPGVPAFWVGHSRRVAWASTHAGAVTLDLYQETLHPTDASLYHDGRAWRALEERTERIQVRDAGEEVLQIRSTQHGPLLDGPARRGRESVALAWVGAKARAGESIAAMWGVARARDAAELRQALRRHEAPVLTFAFLDADGGAGLQLAGWVPRRTLPTALIPVPGRALWYNWRGRIAPEELPQVDLADGAPWAIAADNLLPAAQPGVHIEWLWRSGARARRIFELLERAAAAGGLDLSALTAIQLDTHAETALELVRAALDLVESRDGLPPQAREVARVLEEWGGRESPGSVGAAAQHVFLRSLVREIFSESLGPELLERYLSVSQTDPAQLAVEVVGAAEAGDARGGWTDRASVRDAVVRSLRATWAELSFELGASRRRWQWGRLHTLRFHAFGPTAMRLGLRDGLGPFGYGGSGHTINTADYDGAASFEVRVASTYRFAVDAAHLNRSLTVLAPGQSEHPGHPHYADAVGRWLEGRSSLLTTDRLFVAEGPHALLRLEPQP